MSLITVFDIVLFHSPCPDGSSSGWVYWNSLKDRNIKHNTKYVKMTAGDYPVGLDVNDKTILMMDVCPKKEEIIDICKKAKFLVILDHHKSGEREVSDFITKKDVIDNLLVVFDMNRSGVQIAWDYFNVKSDFCDKCGSFDTDINKGKYYKFDGSNRPWFVDVIADRDLWKWKIEGSKELTSFMFVRKYYDDWNKMNTLLDFTKEQIDEAKIIGSHFMEVDENNIEYAVNTSVLRKFTSADGTCYNVSVTGCSHIYASEVGNRLCEKKDKKEKTGDEKDNNEKTCENKCDFAVMWRYNFHSDEWFISGRTNKDDIDLSLLFKEFGGGGHPKASGFSLPNKTSTLQNLFYDFFEDIDLDFYFGTS